ncbi:MAG: hypothetical protein WBQ69_11210 [Gallionella sp.]
MAFIALLICFPATVFITLFAALILSLPLMVTIPIACIVGIGLYFICLRTIQSVVFPYWDRLAQRVDKTVPSWLRWTYLLHKPGVSPLTHHEKLRVHFRYVFTRSGPKFARSHLQIPLAGFSLTLGCRAEGLILNLIPWLESFARLHTA